MPANKPYVLGVTGGIASGKSAACEYLATLGADVIDADAISHALTAHETGAALPLIREKFGDKVFLENGALNRRALGDIIFSDESKRRALEGILHPMIQFEVLNRAQNSAAKIVVMNVPLLYEAGMDALCDAVWVMSLEPDKQIMRLMNRDQLTREQAEARIASQMPLKDKAARADAVISTDRPIEETQRELHVRYKVLQHAIERE